MSRARIWIVGALILGGTLPARAQTAEWATGAYVYDGAGNIKSIGTTEQYRYDASGRLTSGTIATGQTQTVTYDPYGNIKTITTAGSALAVGVDPATNRATQTHEAQTNTAYNVYATYDLAGRLTSALNGAGGTYSYDALDSVMKSTGNGVTKVHWYTASDERIASIAVDTSNNNTEISSEWTLRDPSGKVLRRLQRTGTQWTWKEDYIYAGSQLLAAETDTPARTLHFFPDHLGTARLITANGGTKVAFHTYYPFGDEATASSQDTEKLKFTGHERDAANLDYMHARYYAPKWGRFLSVDPTWESADLGKPQTWNRYTYALNNPVNLTDPDGKCSICWDLVFADSTGASADMPKDPVQRAAYERMAQLEQRAKAIHDALPEATRRRTTVAVAEVTNPDGSKQTLVASSEKNLRPSQRAVLKPGEVAVSGAGHAEQTIINAAKESGQKVDAIAASRPICPSCARSIKSVGAKAVSVLKKVFKEIIF